MLATGVLSSAAGEQWPPLRAAGLLGVENRGGSASSNQPAAPKKATTVPTGAGAPAPVAPKADKPAGEGSFDDFGFGPETGAKPVGPAAGAGTGKPPEKAAPGAGAKPPAAVVPVKPIGPVRLTARSEPLPKLALIVAAPAAGVAGGTGSGSSNEADEATIRAGEAEISNAAVKPVVKPAAVKPVATRPEAARPGVAGTKPAAQESDFVKGKKVK